MRTVSSTWNELYESDVGLLETKAIINGTEYTEISVPVITRSAMQDAMSVGNVISASCIVTIHTTNTIQKSAQVEIKSRYSDGETTSEWLSMGTFYISKRVKDPLNGLITLECYDALLKANAAADLTLPATMEDIVDDIAEAIGVNIDSRTTILTGGAYTINKIPSSATYRDVLGMIAAANCGNFIITPDNELRLVPLVSLPDPEDEITNLVTVKTFTGTIEIGDERTVTGVLYTDGDAMPVLVGDETGIVVKVSLTYAQATALAQVIIGMTYKPYTITNAWYNPAAEIGDYIAYSNRVLNVIWTETAQYGSGFTGDVSAPEFGDIEDEFPYIGAAQKGLTDAKAYAANIVEASIDDYDEELTQQKVFNRLTNNGAAQGLYMVNGQLYVNASYISTGYLSDANNRNHWDLVNGLFETNAGKIGNWTIANGGLTNNGGDYLHAFDIAVNPNFIKYQDTFVPDGSTTLTLLDYYGITGTYMENDLGACNSMLFHGGEYDGDDRPVGWIGLRANGPVGAGADRGFTLYSGNVTSRGSHPGLNVNAELYVDREVTLRVPLSTESGGTGANTAAGGRANLGALNSANVTDAYSDSATYAVGEYCIYNDTLYVCTTAITTPEAWTAAHWSATTVGAELATRVKYAEIINNLTSTATDKPLSAAQGRFLDLKNKTWSRSTTSFNDALTQIGYGTGYFVDVLNTISANISTYTANAVNNVQITSSGPYYGVTIYKLNDNYYGGFIFGYYADAWIAFRKVGSEYCVRTL